MASPSRRSLTLLVVVSLGVFLLHGTLALLRHQSSFIWDEGRYIEWALYLSGSPVSTFDSSDFVNGPGYPLILVPFVAACPDLEAALTTTAPPEALFPLLLARLLNAVFMGGSCFWVGCTLLRFTRLRWALAAALYCTLHPSLLWLSFSLMTEPLALFCLSGFLWAACRCLSPSTLRAWPWILTAAFFLGWLTLTRVFFGHVILATTLAALIAWPLIPTWRPRLMRILAILAGAFLICSPYLLHTWKVTGSFPCWSTNSGELLYWATSHHPGENGHWFSYEDAQTHPELVPHHRDFFARVLQLPVPEREAAFKAQAKAQFEPQAFAYNWLCNLSRLAFGFPRSHQTEELRTIVLIFTNTPLLLLALFASACALRSWRLLPIEFWLITTMACFYLGGTSLAPGLPRYLAAINPLLVFSIILPLTRTLALPNRSKAPASHC